ncbi:VOC family protein [Candidatus Uabimicrobium sp. HlEnr_7]|uniref:VOC family protein n=1 Tax=Candidatus Uabimicrobium helgolandensis TaxID=3095367 RepID=UPI00355880BC
MIRIHVASVPVNSQEKALKFYTEVLGFIKKTDIPVGEHKWLTVVSPKEQSGVELLLEPMSFQPAEVYQRALKDAGIPWTSFMVDDLAKEHQRLESLGVQFSVRKERRFHQIHANQIC